LKNNIRSIFLLSIQFKGGDWGAAQVVECLLCKHEARVQIPVSEKEKGEGSE
jgi:hypothetical protein